MIDEERVALYVAEIKSTLDVLKSYSEIDKEKFLSSPITIRDTKYCFIVAGQAVVDLYYHLTAKLLKKAPSDYANCFELIGEIGKFDKEVLKCLAKMAKFRNLLVHNYIKVKDELVYEKLNELECFEKFIKDLEKIIL